MIAELYWLIPILPLLAAVICTGGSIMGLLREKAHVPCWIGLGGAAVLSVVALISRSGYEFGLVEGYHWLSIGRVQIRTAMQLDVLSLFQLCVVTVISFVVSVYSAPYMKGDGGYARYFAIFSGFVFAMIMLVMASNLLVLYIFWEGVGLCSYLLVGYWYQRTSAAKAATKAFMVNRVADCAFLAGILALSYGIGQVINEISFTERLSFAVIFDPDVLSRFAEDWPNLFGFTAYCLLIGALGKSAQLPFHVWLPDAMEGPTPASALIHAATMVTAGVYLLARMSPFLEYAPQVLVTAAWIGGITALLAAIIALFQDDLKRVLAYSTVSQLGFMFMAIGSGAGRELMSVAVLAAMFHLATHAFFKALLFLGAGNVMHAMGDVISMKSFSGLRRVLPQTYVLFGIGALALAGIPPLSGFWSKDGILAALLDSSHDRDYGHHFQMLFVLGLVTAFLTAVYTFRAFFNTFHGPLQFPREAGEHPHEADKLQLGPMVFLAVGSVFVGLALGPTHLMRGYFEKLPMLVKLSQLPEHSGWLVPILSTLAGGLGIAVAWFTTQGVAGKNLDISKSTFAVAGQNRFYIDEAYDLLIVRPMQSIADWLGAFDAAFLGMTWGRLVRALGSVAGFLAKTQQGLLPRYASAIIFGLLVLLAIMALS